MISDLIVKAVISALLFGIFFNGISNAEPNAGTSGQEAPEDPAEQFLLGKKYDKGEGLPADKTLALTWYRKAAEQGFPEAQLLLGFIYDQGIGVPQDYTQAIAWYRKAAEQGYAKAQFNLGAMYDEGTGVLQDYQAAAEWYRKAAEQGYAKAQFNLGSMYFAGEGVPKDNALAYMWLKLAAAQGLEDKVKTRLALVKNLTAAQIKNGKKLVHEWQAAHRRTRNTQ